MSAFSSGQWDVHLPTIMGLLHACEAVLTGVLCHR